LDKGITAAQLKTLARDCGFELAGIARAEPVDDFARYMTWVEQGHAASMTYLSDRRAGVRSDPRQLLASAKSILCVGKLYNTPWPYSTKFNETEKGWISRYAWGEDYHDVLRCGLERVAAQLPPGVEWKICVDTAPLLERSYARLAGLGWIAKNTCLINQERGSWFFLGELLLSIDLTPDTPPPERCGTCTRCIDACPTAAIVPQNGWWAVDSRLCISYLTIEHRGPINEQDRPGIGTHVFGCDICQDVCPWNGSEGRAVSVTTDSAFAPREFAPPLEQMAALCEEEFRAMFRPTPVSRAKYAGFLRNVAIAMGNSGSSRMIPALEQLARHPIEHVAEHARWALRRLQSL
jgi:epoxyqueuosine reductase